MSYNIRFSDITKAAIVVQDRDLETLSTSLTFIGKLAPEYSQPIAENFLHLLEHFASPTSPARKIAGQLWYDTATNELKICDKSLNWVVSSGVRRSTSRPAIQDSISGDLWIDSANGQLYLFSNSKWVLVGPSDSETGTTGLRVEDITDKATNTDKKVISFFSENKRIAIISEYEFTSKITLDGFTKINYGITLSTSDFNNDGIPNNKYWGTSEKADALVVGNNIVPAASFLRGDTVSTTNYALNVRTGAGIGLGASLETLLTSTAAGTVLHQKTPGSVITLRVSESNVRANDVVVVSSNKVGINKSPGFFPDPYSGMDATLDVGGTILANGQIKTVDTTDSISTNSGSMTAAGGLGIAKTLWVGENAKITKKLTVGESDVAIEPTITDLLDIGTANQRFRTIFSKQSYADQFIGSFSGNLTGSLFGTATQLALTTGFSLTGDVKSDLIGFNGTSGVQLTTEISQDFINTKVQINNSKTTDYFLVYRSAGTTDIGEEPGLKKINKATLFSSISTVPIGAILPYAGDTAPTGYLLCDGSEQRRGLYSELFAVIGFKYKPEIILSGFQTFALPDLRGRFPAGRENMDNNTYVTIETAASSVVRSAIPVFGTSTTFTMPTASVLNGPFQIGKVLTVINEPAGGLDVSTLAAIIKTVRYTGDAITGNTIVEVMIAAQTLIRVPASNLIIKSYGVVNIGGGDPIDPRIPGASTIGNVGGNSQQVLTIDNLPEHSHDLRDDSGNQYFVTRPSNTANTQSDPNKIDIPATSTAQGYQRNDSGGINTNNTLSQPVEVLNPYQTVNYIIFTGL
jgi:microcystin-dependent protein